MAAELRNASMAASMAALCTLLAATHGNSDRKPIRGGRSGSPSAAGSVPASARQFASTAQSLTVRAKSPSVSTVGLKRLTPLNGSASLLGLKPTIPQYAAGRITEPLVCVPIATGTCPRATAAADHDDDPPGVCAAFQGFLVLAGCMNANSVVTVLPSTIPPARLRRLTHSASNGGHAPA